MICAAAVMLSSMTVGINFASAGGVYADVMSSEGTGTGTGTEVGTEKELAAPQNLRFVDGFIKWDKVEEAYGYTLRMHMGEEDYREFTKYFDYDDPKDEAQVELDRLCIEYKIDFGEYAFSVRTFDKKGNVSEWTDMVTAEYAPEFDAPTNVRVSEEYDEYIEWDGVDGVFRYNIRFYCNDDDRTLYYSTYTSDTAYNYGWLSSGDYLFSVQAMDRDYNASVWTEPILFTHTTSEYTSPERLDAPQNVRFDESGENILWDEVEGAEYYRVDIDILVTDENGNEFYFYQYDYPEEPCCNNWKAFAAPFPNAEYRIYVYAYGNGKSSYSSESVYTSIDMTCDENITVPEVYSEERTLCLDVSSEGVNKYGMTISINGRIVGSHYYWWNDGNEFYDYYAYNLPAGIYDVTIYVVDQNLNYNKKTYSLTLGAEPDETVWIPKIFCKFEELLWDYDRIRHNETSYFWVRITDEKAGKVVGLANTSSEYFYGLNELPNGKYTIETCVYERSQKLGQWSKPLKITVYEGNIFDEKNEIITEVDIPPEFEETVPIEDRVTSVIVVPPSNMKYKNGDNVEINFDEITVKAKEIYDEEGLKRVEEALGHKIKPNQKYNLLDLTLLYNGEDFSNGYEGLVQVIIPIPSGHRDKTFTVFRLVEVDGNMVKEMIPGERSDDSYIIYLEHFSEYVLYGEGNHIHEFAEEWTSDEIGHWKECDCGEKSEEAEHIYGDWTVTKQSTEAEEGTKERNCEVCGYKQTEALSVLPHTHIFGEDWITNKINHWKECECGEIFEEAAHTYGDWTVTKEATETEAGTRERTCEVCGYKQTEALPKLTPAAPPETDKPDDTNDNTNNTDKTDKPEPETPDSNPSMGVPAIETSIVVLAVCGAVMALTAKKRKIK